MSQIAPDIPELKVLPELVRPVVWTRATMRAVGSAETWLLALVCVVLAFSVGVFGGHRILGAFGAIVGALLGVVAALYFVFKVLIQWQARRLLPLVKQERDWSAEFGDAIRAHDRVSALARTAVKTEDSEESEDAKHPSVGRLAP